MMRWAFAAILAGTAAQAEPQPAVAALMHYMDPLEACYDAAPDRAAAQACVGVNAQRCMEAEDGGFSTVGMMFCTLAEYHAWDALLNRDYAVTIAAYKAQDAEDHAAFDGRFGQREESLRDAQRGWIAFRDGQCGLEYALWGSGSMRQIAGAQCLMRMTSERTIALRFLGEDMR